LAREHHPECIADVPVSLKDDLAALHRSRTDSQVGMGPSTWPRRPRT
jgi:hypothetical protein